MSLRHADLISFECKSASGFLWLLTFTVARHAAGNMSKVINMSKLFLMFIRSEKIKKRCLRILPKNSVSTSEFMPAYVLALQAQ